MKGYVLHPCTLLVLLANKAGAHIPVAAFHTPGLRGKNLQATWCVLGGKSRVRAVTLILTPPFKLNPNEAKGVDPIRLLRLIT